MADSALYYPYIDVPETGALNAVLLYWDQLGAIVPRPVSPNSFTRELVAADLVTPIAPQDFLSRDRDAFTRGFAELLTTVSARGAPTSPLFIHVDKGFQE